MPGKQDLLLRLFVGTPTGGSLETEEWKDMELSGAGLVRVDLTLRKLLQNECRNAIKNASALLPLQLSRANLSSKKLIQLKMWRYVFHWNSLYLQDLPDDSNATWPDQLQRDT